MWERKRGSGRRENEKKKRKKDLLFQILAFWTKHFRRCITRRGFSSSNRIFWQKTLKSLKTEIVDGKKSAISPQVSVPF
jgi:GT2 family glycosyltransferase